LLLTYFLSAQTGKGAQAGEKSGETQIPRAVKLLRLWRLRIDRER